MDLYVKHYFIFTEKTIIVSVSVTGNTTIEKSLIENAFEHVDFGTNRRTNDVIRLINSFLPLIFNWKNYYCLMIDIKFRFLD